MSLTGPNIYIDRGANMLTMEGPGWMDSLLDPNLMNRPLGQAEPVKIDQQKSQPEPVRIQWQKGMIFDGLKAHFQDSVNVISNSKLLKTGSLDVCFLKPISLSPTGLSDTRPQQTSSVERMICGDGVYIESRTLDAGVPASYDRMWLKNLEMNNISGDFHGDGPGRLISVRRGGDQGFSMPGGPLGGPARPATTQPVAFGRPQSPPADPNQLTCIHLTFMRSLTGNTRSKDLVFHGHVHAANAPAQSWLTTLETAGHLIDDPAQLGQQAVVLSCDSLEVTDMGPVSGSTGGNGELIGLGNVTAEGTYEGKNFTTCSARLTYAQAKGVLTLEGDGRSDAEFFKQDGPPGTPRSRFAARFFATFSRPV